MTDSVVQEVTRGLRTLTDFFGCDLNQVNKSIKLMVLYSDEPLPDWLRGRPQWPQLPRVTNTIYETVEPVHMLRDREIALRARWIVEHLNKGWSLTQKGFGFECPDEALLYHLRWR